MKQTEIGMIPDDWEVKEIKEFADVTTGNKNTQDAQENGKYPFYVRSPIVERINTFSFDSEGLVTAGDGVGTGKVFHFVKGKFGLHQRAYLVHKFQNVDSKYFYYIFSQNFYERVHSMTAKSSVDSVRREMITQMSIPLPPTLAEQQKIAKALSDVDNVISTLEKLITKKKNLKQGTMQQLLTGKKRLPGFAPTVVEPAVPEPSRRVETTKFKQTEIGEIPEDWEVKELGEICMNFSYGVGAEAKKFDGNIKYIRITDIDESSHLFSPQPITSPSFYTSKSFVKENDLLFARTGASVGKSYIYSVNDGKLVFAGFLMRCNVSNADSKFIFYNTLTTRYDTWVTSESMRSGQPGLNLEQLKKFLVPIPSKPEQTAIANVLSSMDKEIEALNTKLEKYRNLKTGMMQQLLTGKIRLG